MEEQRHCDHYISPVSTLNKAWTQSRLHHASDSEEHLGDDVECWLGTLKSSWESIDKESNRMTRGEEGTS